PRPFVPSSFIDVTKDVSTEGGKRARVQERSALKRTTLLASRRHTAVLTTQSTLAGSTTPSAETVRLSPSAMSSSGRLSTPLITAASLGLEARRNAARGTGRQQRRRTCLYYGSGYGTHSTPYAFAPARSAPAAVDSNVATPSAVSPARSAAEYRGGSSTAQKILDIIGEAPPTRSQAALESQDAINPYELSSPYSVRMRPKTAQRRRVLVPLSARLSQAAEAKQPGTDANSAKSILESIQSAAPPEIQARLAPAKEAAPKPTVAAPPKRKGPAADMTPPPPTTAQISTPATTAAPAAAAAPPALFQPAAAAQTPTKAPTQPPPSKTGPQFSFTLPPSAGGSQVSDTAKSRVSSLAVSELPTFVFSLDGQQTAPAVAAKPLGAGSEWECE
ncbi:hypothetical protein LPJ70_006775, partial [Coemansia sp. RSA 2708]